MRSGIRPLIRDQPAVTTHDGPAMTVSQGVTGQPESADTRRA
jgi:hypothetical protein